MQNATRETLRLFESRLLTAERSASLDMPFAEFFDVVMKALQAAGEISSCTVWLYAHGTAERVITTDESVTEPPAVSSVRGELAEDRVLVEQEKHNSGRVIWCSRCFEDISRYYSLCLEVRTDSEPSTNFLLGNATLALCECLAGWFRRNLIVRMDEKLATQTAIAEFCQRTYAALSAHDYGTVIASEIRLLLKADRVSIINVSGSRSEIFGISGTDRVDKKLEVPQALLALSKAIFESGPTVPSEWNSLVGESRISDLLNTESKTILHDGGTQQVRAFRVKGQGTDLNAPEEWRVLAELFENTARPSEAHWKLCVDQISPALQGARSIQQTRPSFLQRSRRFIVWAGVVVVLLVLSLLPVDFEIDANGRYLPVTERRIFAPGSGIIQELAVQHESLVEPGMQLLRIHSPELILKIQEVLGQLETERVRLSSLRTTRLTEEAGAPSRNGVEQALGGEQAVRQRIEDLESRLQLLKSQESGLIIRADARGRVFRRQLEQDLNSRPVQQGDFLFDLIPEESTWHLEVEVPEELFCYLPAAPSGGIQSVPARFHFASEPDERLQAVVSRAEDSVLIQDGRSYSVVYAMIDDASKARSEKHKHLGASVSVRIHCGRRAVGFVLFREFSEFIREKYFQWF